MDSVISETPLTEAPHNLRPAPCPSVSNPAFQLTAARSATSSKPPGDDCPASRSVLFQFFLGNCSELKGGGFFAKLGTDLQRRNQSGPASAVARGTRNPLLTFPSSLLRLLPSTIVKQRCARERGANPGKPICGATFSSWACRCYGPEIFVPYSFPRGNE